MINKLLCFMFGHQLEKWTGYVMMYRFFGEYRIDERTYYKCKRCGEVK